MVDYFISIASSVPTQTLIFTSLETDELEKLRAANVHVLFWPKGRRFLPLTSS
jgi:hypothetical protein